MIYTVIFLLFSALEKPQLDFSGIAVQEDVDQLERAQRGALSIIRGLGYDQGGKSQSSYMVQLLEEKTLGNAGIILKYAGGRVKL